MVAVQEFLFLQGHACEYFCKACRQLRLWAKEGAPTECGNCGSADIVVGEVGSEVTSELRFGTGRERKQT